jgi:hypothetical protein
VSCHSHWSPGRQSALRRQKVTRSRGHSAQTSLSECYCRLAGRSSELIEICKIICAECVRPTYFESTFLFTISYPKTRSLKLTELHGCETWSLILRGELRLKISQRRLLRRISGYKRGGVEEGKVKFSLCLTN